MGIPAIRRSQPVHCAGHAGQRGRRGHLEWVGWVGRGLVLAAAVALSGCPANEEGVSVVVSLPDQNVAGVAEATLEVDYSGSGARLLAEGGGPACAFILPGIDGDFSDDGRGTLTIRTRGPRALRGPADIAACLMKPGDPESTAADVQARLDVRVAGAVDTAGKTIDLAERAAAHPAGRPLEGEKAVEAAQKAAVKAAAAVVAAKPPSRDTAGHGGATGGQGRVVAGTPRGSAGSGGSPSGPASGPAAGAAPGAATGAVGQAPPRAVARGSAPAAQRPIVMPPPPEVPAAGDAYDEADPAPVEDRDPDYDDSPSDDENAPAYSLELWVRNGGRRFGALQFDITHLGGSGGFIGRGDKIDCVSLVEAIAAANYAGERVAKVGLISLAGIRIPSAIMRCGFRTPEPLTPNSFQVRVTDASDTDSQPLDPMPTVTIATVVRR